MLSSQGGTLEGMFMAAIPIERDAAAWGRLRMRICPVTNWGFECMFIRLHCPPMCTTCAEGNTMATGSDYTAHPCVLHVHKETPWQLFILPAHSTPTATMWVLVST